MNTDDLSEIGTLVSSSVKKSSYQEEIPKRLYSFALKRLLEDKRNYSEFIFSMFPHMPSVVWNIWREHLIEKYSPKISHNFLIEIANYYQIVGLDATTALNPRFFLSQERMSQDAYILSTFLDKNFRHDKDNEILDLLKETIITENGKGAISDLFLQMNTLHSTHAYSVLVNYINLCLSRYNVSNRLNNAIRYGSFEAIDICLKGRVSSDIFSSTVKECLANIQIPVRIESSSISYNEKGKETTELYKSLSSYWQMSYDTHYSPREIEIYYSRLVDEALSYKPKTGWYSYIMGCIGPATTADGLRKIFEQKTKHLQPKFPKAVKA